MGTTGIAIGQQFLQLLGFADSLKNSLRKLYKDSKWAAQVPLRAASNIGIVKLINYC